MSKMRTFKVGDNVSSNDNSRLNNPINIKLNKDYPRNFSLCDIDGVMRYNFWGTNKKRMIFYECKAGDEESTQTQLETLYVLKQNFKWENFDKYSGVFVFRHNLYSDNEDIKNNIQVFEIEYKDNKYIEVEFKTITFDKLHEWITFLNFNPKESLQSE